MNRRSFLTLALAGCTLGVVGCGQAPEAAAESQVQVTGPRPLRAPPLVDKAQHASNMAPHLPNWLEIPRIDVNIPVVELGWSEKEVAGHIFSEWDVAPYAAGWHKNSALPGEQGNAVMSGHNNILGAVFRELDQLKKGDAITVSVGDDLVNYAVDQVVVVPDKNVSDEQRAQNSRWIGSFDDTRLTLVSCWPRNDNTHRILVIARPQLTAQIIR